ncbi:GNAT family N-acetyltransferase [Neobacillus sp. YIM B06451]|uniref:GNAT family N-acetyltransferase n=1 Tax=Neobacillus sp. YIM B06451 TaxID=3070994 RepID=UPI0029313C54|nr:GNAT family N-acetyltransferase [Neobacillus sp. YIM B06451]
MEIIYTESLPSKGEFFDLYETTGWNTAFDYSDEVLHKAISNSWYSVSARLDNRLVGFGRIVSDGFYQTFICDLIVHPDFQRQGIGMKIMQLLMDHCKKMNVNYIQLSCAKGKVGFYEKFGFHVRPSDAPGMHILVKGSN